MIGTVPGGGTEEKSIHEFAATAIDQHRLTGFDDGLDAIFICGIIWPFRASET
jgi:hypothetical protein